MMKPAAEMHWEEPTDAQRQESVDWLIEETRPKLEQFRDYLYDPLVQSSFEILTAIGPGTYDVMQLVFSCLSPDQKDRAIARLAPQWALLNELMDQNRKTAQAIRAKRRRGRHA